MGYSFHDYIAGDICFDEFLASNLAEDKLYNREDFESLVGDVDEDSS